MPLTQIAVNFCEIRRVFLVQFDFGYISLCAQQIFNLMMSIYARESDLFHKALFFSFNGRTVDLKFETDQKYQLEFGMMTVQISGEELLSLMMLMWQKYEDLMQSVVLLSEVRSQPSSYAQ